MRKLLLVGAGHAHLYILKKLKKENLPDVEVTLLSLCEYEYHTEMLYGYIVGRYSLEELRINAKEMAKEAGVNWTQGAAVSIDPERKVLLTEQGKVLEYDAVSFDVGSLTFGTGTTGVIEHAMLLKPNDRLSAVTEALQKALRPVVVGNNRIAVELAFALQAKRREKGQESVVLVSDGGLLEEEGPKVSEEAEQMARKKGMALHLYDGVEAILKNKIVTAANRKISFDQLLWAAGSRPHHMFASSLPTDAEGYLLVEDTLQVKKYPSVFGAGEGVTVNGSANIEKSLFSTIRQAPILWENLKGFFSNGEGELYKPKSSPMKFISVGEEQAILRYKNYVFSGKIPMKMKTRLEKGYLKSLQD